MTITSQDLPAILASHLKWLCSEPGGSRANLYGAYLYGAYLSGADLSGADLSGAKGSKGSKVAAVYPIGDSERVCQGVIAQTDDTHAKPFLWLVCGCFSGDEKAYKAKVAKRYKKGSAHFKQCMAAMVAIKAIASTWKIEK